MAVPKYQGFAFVNQRHESFFQIADYSSMQLGKAFVTVCADFSSMDNNTMNAVAEYGVGLELLDISEIALRDSDAIARMLEVTGQTLRTLRLRRIDDELYQPVPESVMESWFDVTTIPTFSLLVTDLPVGFSYHTYESHDDRVLIFGSYGRQLSKIGFCDEEQVSEELCRTIFENCSRASTEASSSGHDYMHVLGILGRQIEVLTLREEENDPDLCGFSLSLSTKCRNVRYLSIGLKGAQAFFVAPKRALERLRL